MRDKLSQIEDAVAHIQDSMTIMIGGFGMPGTPFCLIDELVRQGAKNLTVIKNDANESGAGIDRLLAAGQIRRLITTHIGLNPRAIAAMHNDSLEVEFNSQGILAERIRAAGVGLKGIVTDIGCGTLLAEGKPRLSVENKVYIFESALRADIALIHAARADHFGNLRFAATARNFNPLMAMAADFVIAQAEQVAILGEIDPDDIHTPGPFVDAVVAIVSTMETHNAT